MRPASGSDCFVSKKNKLPLRQRPSFFELSDSSMEEEEDDHTERTIVPTPATPRSVNRERVLNASIGLNSVPFKSTRADHTQAVDAARSKRLDYLLRQSEIFSHFVKPAYTDVHGEESGSSAVGTSKKWKRILKKNDAKGLLVQADRKKSNEEKHVPQFESSPPFIKNTKMRDYQIRGLNWLISLYENGINGILADEMGLGKTIQTISLLGYLQHSLGIRGPHLIVVPLSILSNWKIEFEKWCPSLKCVTLTGTMEERFEFIQNVLKKKKWNVCITSYEILLREIGVLRRLHWIYVIIDEGHRIKNENTKMSQSVRLLKSRNRLLLTGTPLQNNLHELWALLNMLLPDVFNSAEDFDSWFDTNDCLGDTTMVDRLHGILRPFLLRRIKADVEKSLLPKKELKIYVGLTELQREWYRKVLLDEVFTLSTAGFVTKARMLNSLMHLRKVSNHPYTFKEAEPGPPYVTDNTIVTSSGKMIVLDKLLQKLEEQGSRVLIFSQFTTMLDILEDYLIWRKWSYCRFDGTTNQLDRQMEIESYNDKGSKKFVFLLSTRSGGLGINLATADVVIIYDSDWNPQADIQAVDRCHRIGQTKQVRIFRLITENTVEEKVVERAEVKLHLDRKVIQQGRLLDSGNNAPTKNDMMQMIGFGAESIIASTVSTVMDETIDEILSRSKVRTDLVNDKLGTMEESALRNFTIDEPIPNLQQKIINVATFPVYSCHDFEGIDYKALRDKKKKVDYVELEGGRRRKDMFAIDNVRSNEKNDPTYVPVEMESSNDDDDSDEKSDNATTKNTPSSIILSQQLQVQPKFLCMLKPKPLFDFQFCSPRLIELYYQDLDYYKRYRRINIPLLEGIPLQDACKFQMMEKQRLGNCRELTTEERLVKKELMKTSFSTLRRPQFMKYFGTIIKNGLDNLEAISTCINKMAAEDVIAYHQVFLLRYVELCDVEALIRQCKIDALIPALSHRKELLAEKMRKYSNPIKDLELIFHPSSWQGTRFTLEQDRIILVTLNGIFRKPDCVTPFETLQSSLKNSPDMDWFLRTRTREELHARCNMLFYMLEQEHRNELAAASSQLAAELVTIQDSENIKTEILKKKKYTKKLKKSSIIRRKSISEPATPVTAQKRKILEGGSQTSPQRKIPRLENLNLNSTF